jgi:Predicted membrane protein (DUF2207) C-terminal domain
MTYWLIPGCLFLYYVIVWLAVGRDPKPGPLVPRYDAPDGLSPAAVRYITTSGSDRKTLVAVLLSLVAKKCIDLRPGGNNYIATRLVSSAPDALAAEEKLTFNFLFDPATRQKLKQLGLQPSDAEPFAELDKQSTIQPYDKGNSALVSAIQQTLCSQYRGKYFKSNLGYIAFGVLGSAALIAKIAAAMGGSDLVWLSMEFLFAGIVCSALVMVNLIPGVRDIVAGSMSTVNAAWFLLGLVVISCLLSGFGFAVLQHSNADYVELLASLLPIHAIWAHLVKAPTLQGRRTMDDILGFREFLLAAEQDRLDKLNHPDLTPQYLNACLAYAVALDVKEAWGDAASNRLFESVVPAR